MAYDTNRRHRPNSEDYPRGRKWVASKTFRFAVDKVVPREFSEKILCYQPSAEIVTIPGDHFALWKNAACWTETITRFAQGAAGSRPERDVSTVARL